MNIGDEVEYLYKGCGGIVKHMGVILKIKGFLSKKYIIEKYTELSSGKKVPMGICDTVKEKEILIKVK